MAIYIPDNDAELSAIVTATGDTVLLKSGRTYSASAVPASLLTPSNITLGVSGTGAKPIITGGVTRADWTYDAANNVYSRPAYASNVLGNVTEDGVPMKHVPWTTNLATTAALMVSGKNGLYWSGSMTFDPTARILYIRPSTGTAIQHLYVVSETLNGLANYSRSRGLVIDGMDIRSVSRHGIDSKQKTNLVISNCDFNVIGGAKPGSLWLGNGIELSLGVWGAEVRDCVFYDVFDSPVTSQLYEGSAATIGSHLWKNLTFIRYGLAGVEVSIHTANQEIRDIETVGITSVDNGTGWGGDRNGGVITNVVTNPGSSRIVRSFARDVTGSVQRRLYLGYQHGGYCGIEDAVGTGTYGQGVRSDQGTSTLTQRDLRRNVVDNLSPMGSSWSVVTARLADTFTSSLI